MHDEVHGITTPDFLDAEALLQAAEGYAAGKEEIDPLQNATSGRDGATITRLVGEALRLLTDSLHDTYSRIAEYLFLCAVRHSPCVHRHREHDCKASDSQPSDSLANSWTLTLSAPRSSRAFSIRAARLLNAVLIRTGDSARGDSAHTLVQTADHFGS